MSDLFRKEVFRIFRFGMEIAALKRELKTKRSDRFAKDQMVHENRFMIKRNVKLSGQ